MTINIRHAKTEDSSAIATVHIASWHETYRGLLPDDLLDNLRHDDRANLWVEIIALNAQYPMNAQFVAEVEGTIVGFGSCGQGRSKDCLEAGYQGEISTLYVLKNHQNLGLGSEIFSQMTKHLLANEITTASLWVLDTNVHARCFYEKRGGVSFGERTDDHRGCSTTEISYGWRDLTQ